MAVLESRNHLPDLILLILAQKKEVISLLENENVIFKKKIIKGKREDEKKNDRKPD